MVQIGAGTNRVCHMAVASAAFLLAEAGFVEAWTGSVKRATGLVKACSGFVKRVDGFRQVGSQGRRDVVMQWGLATPSAEYVPGN